MKVLASTKAPTTEERLLFERTNWPEWTWPNLQKCSRNDYHPPWLPCGPVKKSCPLCGGRPQAKALDEETIERVKGQTEGQKGTDWDTAASYEQYRQRIA